MQIRKRLSTAAVAIGLAFAGPFAVPLAAQDAVVVAQQFSDEDLAAFITAALAVNDIEMAYQEPLMTAESPEEQQQVIEAANAEMIDAIETTPGISLDDYMVIGQAAETDAELNARLMALLEAMQPAQ